MAIETSAAPPPGNTSVAFTRRTRVCSLALVSARMASGLTPRSSSVAARTMVSCNKIDHQQTSPGRLRGGRPEQLFTIVGAATAEQDTPAFDEEFFHALRRF
jgi:hypothetical protein